MIPFLFFFGLYYFFFSSQWLVMVCLFLLLWYGLFLCIHEMVFWFLSYCKSQVWCLVTTAFLRHTWGLINKIGKEPLIDKWFPTNFFLIFFFKKLDNLLLWFHNPDYYVLDLNLKGCGYCIEANISQSPFVEKSLVIYIHYDINPTEECDSLAVSI